MLGDVVHHLPRLGPIFRGAEDHYGILRLFSGARTWKELEYAVLPRLLARNPRGELRAWCVGPKAVDDALSLLLLVTKYAGLERSSGWLRIFATSSDGSELRLPRGWCSPSGSRGADDLELSPCFERTGEHWYLRPSQRDALVIGSHDLTSSAPLGNLDLLFCRDVLAELEPAARRLVLRRLNFALKPHGHLVVSERDGTDVSQLGLYQQTDGSSAIVRKARACGPRSLMPLATVRPRPRRAEEPAGRLPALVDAAQWGHAVIDGDARLVVADVRASRLLCGAAGEPCAAVLRLLRSLVETVPCAGGTGEIRRRDVDWYAASGVREAVDIELLPAGRLADGRRSMILRIRAAGASEIMEWRSRSVQASLDLDAEAMRASDEELRATAEEMERDNERLQAANERLALSNATLTADQADLRRQVDQLGAAFEVLPDAVLMVAADDGTVVGCNQAAAARLGRSGAALAGRKLSALLSALPGAGRGMRTARFGGRAWLPVSDGVALIRRGDGTSVTAELEVIRTAADRRELVVLLLRDGRHADGSQPARTGPGGPSGPVVLADLTPRERDVIRLLVAGRQSKEIAHELGISRRTVDVHRGRLMRKVGARNLADLLRLALADGTSVPEPGRAGTGPRPVEPDPPGKPA